MDRRSEELARLYRQLRECCQSKAEEFGLLGYDNVTAEDIWECVAAGYKEVPPLHRAVNDVLSLKPDKYMNWLMVNLYKSGKSI